MDQSTMIEDERIKGRQKWMNERSAPREEVEIMTLNNISDMKDHR